MARSFSDDEVALLLHLSQPIEKALRPQFLAAVEAALEGQGGGPGVVHRIGRVLQRDFWTPPQSTAAGTPQRRA